jgi:cell division GTPase FtsZ
MKVDNRQVIVDLIKRLEDRVDQEICDTLDRLSMVVDEPNELIHGLMSAMMAINMLSCTGMGQLIERVGGPKMSVVELAELMTVLQEGRSRPMAVHEAVATAQRRMRTRQ